MSINNENCQPVPDEETRKRISITIDSEILETGKLLAKADNRSLSNYFETLIIEKSEKLQPESSAA